MPENNNQLQQLQPQYIQPVYIQQQPYEEEEEIDLIELFTVVWKRKWFIFFTSFIFGVIALAYAFWLPFIYRAECRIMAPQGGSAGRIASLMASMGGLANFMGVSGAASAPTANQMILGVMKGDSVVDVIIDKFNLMEEYKQDYRLYARQAVLKNLEAEDDTKSGIISVAYLHKDPQRAADIANAFVEELQRKILEISVADAQQSRLFFEKQLIIAQQELSDAEDAMMNYQQSSGVIEISSQARSILAAIASLRNQIAAKNVEISSMRSYLRNDNPRLRLAQSQLQAMQKELNRLEEEQKRVDPAGTSKAASKTTSGDTLLSVAQVPEMNVEYQRYTRNLRLANAKYDLMIRQYENARLGEASDISTISIVDPAIPPDYKYKPKRGRIAIIGAMIGFMLSGAKVVIPFMFSQLKKDKDEDEEDDE